MVRHVETAEPHLAQFREHAPLVGNAVGQNPIEGTNAVAGDKQQAIAKVVDVADLSATDRHTGNFTAQQDRTGHSRFLKGPSVKGVILMERPLPINYAG